MSKSPPSSPSSAGSRSLPKSAKTPKDDSSDYTDPLTPSPTPDKANFHEAGARKGSNAWSFFNKQVEEGRESSDEDDHAREEDSDVDDIGDLKWSGRFDARASSSSSRRSSASSDRSQWSGKRSDHSPGSARSSDSGHSREPAEAHDNSGDDWWAHRRRSDSDDSDSDDGYARPSSARSNRKSGRQHSRGHNSSEDSVSESSASVRSRASHATSRSSRSSRSNKSRRSSVSTASSRRSIPLGLTTHTPRKRDNTRDRVARLDVSNNEREAFDTADAGARIPGRDAAERALTGGSSSNIDGRGGNPGETTGRTNSSTLLTLPPRLDRPSQAPISGDATSRRSGKPPKPAGSGKSGPEVVPANAEPIKIPPRPKVGPDKLPTAPASQKPLVRGDLSGPLRPLGPGESVGAVHIAGESAEIGAQDVSEDGAASKAGAGFIDGVASSTLPPSGRAEHGESEPPGKPDVAHQAEAKTAETRPVQLKMEREDDRIEKPEMETLSEEDASEKAKRHKRDETGGDMDATDSERRDSRSRKHRASVSSKETNRRSSRSKVALEYGQNEATVGQAIKVKLPRTELGRAHRAARAAVLAGAPLLLALPLGLLSYLTTLLLLPIFGPPANAFAVDALQIALAIFSSLVVWNATKVRGIRASLSVKVCLCLVALSADLVATSGRRLAGVFAASMAPKGISIGGEGTGGMDKGFLVTLGLLGVGDLVGGSAFAAVCYDHIYPFPNSDEWPLHLVQSGIFTAQVMMAQKTLQWGLAGSTNVLVQRPEQSILLISLLLTLLALALSEPPRHSFARYLHTYVTNTYRLSPSASAKLWSNGLSYLPRGTFPLFLLLRLPIIVITLRQQIFLRPSPPYSSNGVRVLSSERGHTGLISVGEGIKRKVRYLRRDDAIIGARWARSLGGAVTLGDTLVVPLQEAALLVDRLSPADSVARTVSLTTSLQFPDNDDDAGAEKRALVIGIGIGTQCASLQAFNYIIDAVEPEPLIYHAAVTHFNMSEPDTVNIADGYSFVRSVAAIRADEAYARAARLSGKGVGNESGGAAIAARNMLEGTSPLKRPDHADDGNEDDQESGDEGLEGSAKWSTLWADGRSLGLPRGISANEIQVFWGQVREMVSEDGVFALDLAGIDRPKRTIAALLEVFEQCRAFAEARNERNAPSAAELASDAVPAMVICTPSLSPLTFRRPTRADVRRSPIRALMYDAFLRHEVALVEYVSDVMAYGTTEAGKDEDEGHGADGMGARWSRWSGNGMGARWRDRKQVDMMRAMDGLLASPESSTCSDADGAPSKQRFNVAGVWLA